MTSYYMKYIMKIINPFIFPLHRSLSTTPASDLLLSTKIRLSDGSSFFLRNKDHRPIIKKRTAESNDVIVDAKVISSESELPPLVHKQLGSKRIYISPIEKVQMQTQRDQGLSTLILSQKFNCTEETVETYTTLSDVNQAKSKKIFDAKFDAMTWTEKVRVVNRIRRKAMW